MKRKHKSYSRPRRAFEKERILAENTIKEDFGLKNKTEIWKAEARIKTIREKAKILISAKLDDQKAFFDRLNKMGLNVKSIPDVLSLTKEDYLNRRLQTILVKKRLAKTPKAARQMIVHKKVMVNGMIVNSPSYLISINMEDKISLKPKKEKKIKEEIKQETE